MPEHSVGEATHQILSLLPFSRAKIQLNADDILRALVDDIYRHAINKESFLRRTNLHILNTPYGRTFTPVNCISNHALLA